LSAGNDVLAGLLGLLSILRVALHHADGVGVLELQTSSPYYCTEARHLFDIKILYSPAALLALYASNCRASCHWQLGIAAIIMRQLMVNQDSWQLGIAAIILRYLVVNKDSWW
jgi:hypothetical protein